MKRPLIAVAVLLGILVILSIVRPDSEERARRAVSAPAQVAEAEPEPPEEEERPTEMDAARDEVVELFQGPQEPTAKDAVWTSDSIFKVGVIDDGTERHGYALYVCEVLYEHGFRGKGIWVQVIDIVKLTATNDWVKLGEAHCS